MTARPTSELQQQFYDVIFGTESPTGKWFDIALIATILSSVLIIMLDSIEGLHLAYGDLFWRLEWIFTLLFTLEYMVRVWCSPNRKAYVLSVYGVVDLIAILPTYLALLFPVASSLLIVRLLRILRIFRVLRLVSFMSEANILAGALRRSTRKIVVFFSMMMVITVIFGCLIYVVEGPANGFNNIPVSIYWAIVTITTVGYGDIVPVTALGRAISATGMLIGYAIIAVPTGIITAELASGMRGAPRSNRNCAQCARAGHELDARYCKYCGTDLPSLSKTGNN
ncbi:ion transporter [Parahaliea sp. F7430]|uniref:Ion transporter n=1 Tax=Sediminihaliea albiluteola TaxID=2758564 RepID=A0A7W2YJL6_9GAMM|nr:ion transporter [Sediminihaliea albiluteola]MBA6412443.1 ion transporter [Sediminihaliea albiluteola]